MSLLRLRLISLLAFTTVGWLGLLCLGQFSTSPFALSRPLYAQQAAATPTSVPITPTATLVWVTPTPPAADLFAAATLSVRMTAAATTTGTATPLPANWKVAAVRLLPYVPEPENQATAEILAMEATARAVTTGEPAGVIYWTATPRPPAPPTATPTPTTPPTIVTATFTPVDVLAAATWAAQATLDATTTGTATPLPKFVVLATNTPKPIIVTSTATPENAATAQSMAVQETAIAFTTGVPEPGRFVTATPTNLPPAPTARPVNTATPIFIPLAALTATATPGATPPFPALLVGKILFLADNDGRRGPEAYLMNADGSDVALLTALEFYNRAQAREAYSADRRYHTFVQSAGSGQKQIFYRDTVYGTEQSMTRFGVGNAWDPRWSPTADVVVLVANESRNDELWLVRKDEWPAVQLTQNEWAWDKHPSWSPDGTQIVFMSNRSGSQQLWLMDAEGSNQRQLTNFAFEVWDPVWVKYTDQ